MEKNPSGEAGSRLADPGMVDNPSYEGNPFDVEAQVTFTHQESDETRRVALFYDSDNTWKFRFTATQPGEWSLQTASSDQDLDGMTGTVTMTDNPHADAHGFMTSFGNKWGWQGTEEAFIPQYVMGKDLEYYYDLDKDNSSDRVKRPVYPIVRAWGSWDAF